MRGRKTKLTRRLLEEIKKIVEDDLLLGMPIDLIADELGISRPTFYNWMDRGGKQASGLYREFLDIIKRGQALFAKRNLAVVSRAERNKDTTWTPAAWLLERRMPEYFGKREQHEISGDGLKWVVEFVNSEDKGE